MNNLRLVLTAGASIPGRLILETASVDAIPRGINIILAREPDVVGLPAQQARGAVQPDGTFILQSVAPGDYRMYVTPFIVPFQWGAPAISQQLQNMFVKSIRLGGVDVLADGLRVEGGGPGDIQILMGSGGRFQGQTSDEKHQPLPNVTVALVPDLGFRGRRELYRSTSSDISGRFQMQGIAPGNYKAFAWEVVERDVWQNPEYIRAIEDRGAPIVIREGSQSNTEVVAIPAPRR